MSLFPDTNTVQGIPLGTRIQRKFDVGAHPAIVGQSLVGSVDTVRGNPVIFRWRPGIGQEKMAYYRPTNPQTEDQQAWRSIFADAVAAWQALTDAERDEWHAKGKKRRKMGYSMFLTDYLITHKL